MPESNIETTVTFKHLFMLQFFDARPLKALLEADPGALSMGSSQN